MGEFWEDLFMDNKELWGFEPAKSAELTKDFFVEKGIKHILIPGIGYGRNAQIFRENGISVTGIEISQTAIDLAHKHYGNDLTIHHGSVTKMPFGTDLYDGIFCHALLHLLNYDERAQFISNCYNQLSKNGYMVFTVATKDAPIYGQGKSIGKERYQLFGGINMFFYDIETINQEFSKAGLVEISIIEDVYPFYFIICSK